MSQSVRSASRDGQESLRDEARGALLADTGLFALHLQDRFGEPTVTGSASYDLMVWRDIDIDLAVDADRWADWMAFGGDLVAQFDAVGLTLHRATFRQRNMSILAHSATVSAGASNSVISRAGLPVGGRYPRLGPVRLCRAPGPRFLAAH